VRLIVCLAAALVFTRFAFAQSIEEVPQLGALFHEHAVEGTFVLFDREANKLSVWNAARSTQRFVPASTFKIANTLIGLDAGSAKDVDEVLPYGGKPQPFKTWERDMNLRDAIKASAVPIYQQLARRTGLERMREGVHQLGYGNMEIGDVVDRFWLDGPLTISAVEQTEFLSRLADSKVPFSAATITLLEKTESYELHGKTGWYWPKSGQQIGWWVGWIERDGKTYPFALNIDMNADADAEKRIPLARACLIALGKL
jgi:beta-lactamase class D